LEQATEFFLFMKIKYSEKSLINNKFNNKFNLFCRADPDGWTLCDAGHTGRAESHDAALYQKVEHGHLATSNNPYLRIPQSIALI
jgi:hypothetical protein